mmetsp:Transcript_50354/g.146085  ORF Transcript_50354/g.146085 Transcript_50354/m.146085 type:complete len:545 (+) Transcript_50354:94-1728(+)
MAKTGKHVASQPYRWPFDGDLRPENTALIAIDMQTDFCGKGGYVDTMGYDISMTRAPIEPLQAVFAGFRKLGFHILHTREGHKPSLSDCPANKRWRSRQIGAGIGDPGPCGRVLVRGEPGWNLIAELEPASDEEVIDKPGKGSFVATDIDLILRQRGIRNLVLTGITTDVCVSTTMREANDLGYECLLLSDCTAATDYGNYMATLKTTALEAGVFGCVAAAADLLKAIGADVPASIEAGLEVVDLGDGISVRMPKPPAGLWMPKSLADVEVAPQKPTAASAPGQAFIAADPYLWPFDGDLRPENTALLAVDFQSDFLSPEGYLAHVGYDVGLCRAVVEPSARLMGKMRAKGFHVLHTREGHAADLSDCPQRKVWRLKTLTKAGVGEAGPLGRFLIRGEKGWDFVPELAALPGEAVIDKPAYGAFSLTSLEVTLRSLGVRNLVLVGVTADVCVHTTLRQANDRGFECLLVSDCIASVTPDVHLSALKQAKMQHGVFGAVTASGPLLEVLEGLPDKASRALHPSVCCDKDVKGDQDHGREPKRLKT